MSLSLRVNCGCGADLDLQEQVAARTTARAGSALPLQPQGLAVGSAWGNGHLQPPAIRQEQFALRAVDGIEKVDLDRLLQVGPSHLAGVPPRAAEQVGENVRTTQVVEEFVRVGIAGATGPRLGVVPVEAALRPRRAGRVDLAAIVGRLLLGVRQQVVGGSHFLEALLRSLVAGAQVGMVRPRQLAVRLLDFLLAGALGNPEDFVGIAHDLFRQRRFGGR